MRLPELMTGLGGERITSVADWENYRRPELLTLLENFIYGVRPAAAERNLNSSFEILEEKHGFDGKPILFRKIRIMCAGYSFFAYGYLPEGKKDLPSFINIMHEYQESRTDYLHSSLGYSFDIADITRRGYAFFIMPTAGIYPDTDHHADYKAGVFAHFQPDRSLRRDNDWATISAWAWGASRVLDYIEACPDTDGKRVAVVGHSRGGKTALWCGATDPRVVMSVSNASGCSGAMLHRARTDGGETVKDISQLDWFCSNYGKYAEREEMLPFDQHMLIALQAPRLCYVASCSEDDWASPYAERESCRQAAEAYELYGKKGIVLPEERKLEDDVCYHEGSIGYHMKKGDHGLCPDDWTKFMDFREKHGM